MHFLKPPLSYGDLGSQITIQTGFLIHTKMTSMERAMTSNPTTYYFCLIYLSNRQHAFLF